jgi:serine/threonine protein kinase
MPDSGKYKVLHELGSGGMGHVYKGLVIGQAGFQRPVVMKQLRDAHDPSHLQLFVDEARRYALLDHENIGRIFDFERVGEDMCIVLEFIDGWTVVDYIERHRQLGRLPDVELSVFIASRVCRGLQYVFERAAIVHRDVSPSNIMMTREGTVKLIDFGIAVRSGTRDESLAGKPAYMAPEMVLELRADNRSDLFSLGSVLFETLTLDRLFKGESASEILEQVIAGHPPSPRDLNPAIPDGVMTILRRALQRDPGRRFASAGEMGEACEHYLYDKGYGPTNLTLKQYLHDLFPPEVMALPESALEPLDDTAVMLDHHRTPVAARRNPVSETDATVAADAPPRRGASGRERRARPRTRAR